MNRNLSQKTNNLGVHSPLYTWNGLALFIGRSFATDPHKHDCLQLTIDLKSNFYLKDKNRDWQPFSAALIASSHYHQLNSNHSSQLFLYLDPETEYAKKLADKYLQDQPISALDNLSIGNWPHTLAQIITESNCHSLHQICMYLLNRAVQSPPSTITDQRVEQVIHLIQTSQDFPNNLIQVLAQKIHLSESRLRHLFRAQVGQSLKSFILWTKVLRSLDLLTQGENIKTASYTTGFWDTSHFDKTMKKLLGITPSKVLPFESSFRIKVCSKSNFYTVKTDIQPSST